ncbi:MAG TPA: glycosyltransferase [Solirubrobacteraceae bacterium]|nr:glycosyltransferase [Solirubrobacteraceae bacterium]
MRVLCIGNRYPPSAAEGGYEVIWAGAVNALRADGNDVRVLTTAVDPPSPSDVDIHRELEWYWRDHRFPQLSLRDAAMLERRNATTVSHHLSTFSPQVVCFWSMGGMSLSLLSQVHRAALPAVAVVCDDWIAYGPRVDRWTARWRGLGRVAAPLASALYKLPTRLELDGVARWLFISAHTLDVARAQGWRLPGARVEHAGIDAARFQARAPGQWEWRLLYPGRLDPRKGVDTAIEALALLPEEATLTVRGDGDPTYPAELRALAERLGVADRVGFGRYTRDGVAGAYAAADAIVFPVTWQEPWGLVPLEAMAVGRPVLASRAGGGAAEYLADGVNCLQFEPRDAEGLAAAVRRLAAEAGLRDALRAGGAATAARFTDGRFHAALSGELLAACRSS